MVWKPKKPALMMRTCDSDMRSYGGFKWKKRGVVVAPDWKRNGSCKNGLFGLLWGQGDTVYLSTCLDAVWMAVEIDETKAIDLGNKIKVPAGKVVLTGSREQVASYIAKFAPYGVRVPFAKTEGRVAFAGENGEAISEHREGMAVAGICGSAKSGVSGISVTGLCGLAISEDCGLSKSGSRGKSRSGSYGTAISGDYGMAEVGEGGVAIVGFGGAAMGELGATLLFRDGGKVAIVGQGKIKPNTWYVCFGGKVKEAQLDSQGKPLL